MGLTGLPLHSHAFISCLIAHVHEACRVRSLLLSVAGQIRGGGGGKAGQEAEKAIEAIRDAKKLLGKGPRFREVDASAINAGKTALRYVPQMHTLLGVVLDRLWCACLDHL